MLIWMIIIALLAIGLALVVIELVFIPGTTVVGILGAIFSIFGIVLCYGRFGPGVGSLVLVGMAVVLAGTLYYSFRSKSWSKFALNTSIDSKVNEGLFSTLQVGDEGIALSTLRPGGKASFEDIQFEVRTEGNYVEQGKTIRIREIRSNQIIVEPIN